MTDYKELIQALRNCDNYNAGLTTTSTLESEAANAIEELSAKLDKINSLKHDGYYTGTYIQSLIESEERSSDWKDESVTFFPANKEIEE